MKNTLGIMVFVLAFFSLAYGQDYIIGEGDVLKMTVYDNDDLTTTVRVSGEGRINLPLIGTVDIGGLSMPQALKKITDSYAAGYLVDPQVQLFVQEFQSKRVTILGQVIRPGQLELSKRTTLLDLISKAGGLAKDAGREAVIKRKNSESEEPDIIRVDLERLIELGDTTQNLVVQDGDTVYVSKEEELYVYVSGEVRHPDAYRYDEDKPLTVLHAVTIAGGLTAKASAGRIRVVRKKDTGENEVFKGTNMDFPLIPGDVVVVPESFF